MFAETTTRAAVALRRVFTFYEKTPRTSTSPWKGMNALVAGKPLLQTDPNSTHPMIWLLQRISKQPRLLVQAGITMEYRINEAKRIVLDFYLHMSRVLGTVVDCAGKLREIFKNSSQIVLKNVIQGPAGAFGALNDFDTIRAQDDTDCQNNLDFEKFFEYCQIYQKKCPMSVPEYKLNVPTAPDTYYYYPYLGVVCQNLPEPQAGAEFEKLFSVKGGILADEMGLGKTVQVLSLISTHQRDRQPKVSAELAEPEEDVVTLEEEDGAKEEYVGEQDEQSRIAEMSFVELSSAKSAQSTVSYSIPDTTGNMDDDVIQCTECSTFCVASVCGIPDSIFCDFPFVCPDCTSKKPRTPVKTTLIIVPESLVFQWYTEIKKHCSKSVSAMFYFGVKRHGYLQPETINEYDVILTTYDTLRAEIQFSDNTGPKRTLRTDQKPLFLTTSMVHVKFWRVIVDESQVMPQSANSQVSKMLLKIHADNWWCVTGTPLVKGIADLIPLFSFLDMLPFSIPGYFEATVLPQYLHLLRFHPPLNRTTDAARHLPPNLLLEALAHCLSRKTKREVDAQIRLPGLVEIEKSIPFTAIEERQYKEEREKLKKSVCRALGAASSNSLLRNHKQREKVLQELRTLRETILTGQPNRADLATSGCIYAPETVIFRLVVSKKKSLLEKFRRFVMSAHAVAGVRLLAENKLMALEEYSSTLDVYQEILDFESFVVQTLGADKIKELIDGSELQENETFNEHTETFETPESEDKNAKIESEVRTIKRHLEKIRSKFTGDDGAEPGPAPKKMKVEEVDDVKPDAVEDELQKMEFRRKQTARKLLRLALKPMKMDSTQELHLILNMYDVQKSLRMEQLVDRGRVEVALQQDYGHYVEQLEEIKEKLARIGSEVNAIDLIPLIRSYIANNSSNLSSTSFYNHKHEINNHLADNLLPLVPFIALHDETCAKSQPIAKHIPRTCMGGCSGERTENEQYLRLKNRALTVDQIVEKTLEVMTGLEARRAEMVRQMDDLLDLVMKMSVPATLIDLLSKSDTEIPDLPSEKQQMLAFFECKHALIKGTQEDREAILCDRSLQNCALCEQYQQICQLQFDAGFSSYHGDERNRSGVFEFARYLVDQSTTREDKTTFVKETLRPFFERIQELTVIYKRCIVNIALELICTFEEFHQAKSKITLQHVTQEVGAPDGDSWNLFFETYAACQTAERTQHLDKFRLDLGELRYLVNLMHSQVLGEQGESDECPVCKCEMDAFMVFVCGHRICPECFESLRKTNRRCPMLDRTWSPDSITCPTCRRRTNYQQVMLARTGFAEQNAVVPGMVLSAKMTTAVMLIREVLAENSKNKLILFTQVEPNSTKVWEYLQKIMRMARIPHMAMTRQQFGKKVADFDNGDSARVLLCSLSLCANGLNITGANHIIFLDPPHQKSVLQQAMGRINRFGQRKEMKVFHIVVQGSIDVELRESAKTCTAEVEKKGWTVGEIRQMFGICELNPVLYRRRGDEEDEDEDDDLAGLPPDIREFEMLAGLPLVRHFAGVFEPGPAFWDDPRDLQ
uniref:RING-type domain-containing protein n=1 Tax=Caenorhabditis japonica TaxID=281687 RepID=A0A8R1HZ22_CAEJA